MTDQEIQEQTGRQTEAGGGPYPVVMPVDDPISALPEVAVNILQAARRIVAERGFETLTLNNVALESGENKAMTAYYFGNKAGLVATLVDSVIHNECLDAASRMRGVSEEHRLSQLVVELRNMSETTEDFRVFFDVLPHSIRDEQLRRRLATLYEWYIDLKFDWLGVDREDEATRRRLRGLAQVMSALIDGLAIQALIDPEEFALEPAFEVIGRLFERGLPELLAGGSQSAES